MECKSKLKSGPNKGKKCGKKVYQNGYCKLHNTIHIKSLAKKKCIYTSSGKGCKIKVKEAEPYLTIMCCAKHLKKFSIYNLSKYETTLPNCKLCGFYLDEHEDCVSCKHKPKSLEKSLEKLSIEDPVPLEYFSAFDNLASKSVYSFQIHKESFSSGSVRGRRINREVKELKEKANLAKDIFVRIDPIRPFAMKVLIIGPENTPYHHGMFEFDLWACLGYPATPPKVSFLTTGGGRVQFSDFFTRSGKISLPLLGTNKLEYTWKPEVGLWDIVNELKSVFFQKTRKESDFTKAEFIRYAIIAHIGNPVFAKVYRKYVTDNLESILAITPERMKETLKETLH